MEKKYSMTPVPFRVWIIVLMAAASVCLQTGPALSVEVVRVGFSRSVIGNINENDTMAAVKLWSTQLVGRDDFVVNVEPKVYENISDVETALRQHMVDLINLSAADFFDLRHLLDHEQFIVALYGGSITVEYLLLARKKRRISDIKDLKGGVLRFPLNARTAISTIWLDVKLAETGFQALEQFFGNVVLADKIGDALLPVFFGKADACLVTRNGFDTMAELNPQISHQLRVLAASKKYVPGSLAFRKNYQSELKDVIINNIKTWHQTPAGRQILTMFQMDDLVVHPLELLGPTMELIKEHRQLFGGDSGTSRPESSAKAGNF